MTEQAPTLHSEGKMIRVTGAVKTRLEDIQRTRMREYGRAVTFSEVIEQLLADQWGDET